MFDNDTRIPSDFKCDFLKSSQNENDLHIYFTGKINAVSSNEKNVVASYSDSILSRFDSMQYKRILPIAPPKKQINVSFAISLTVQNITSKI